MPQLFWPLFSLLRTRRGSSFPLWAALRTRDDDKSFRIQAPYSDHESRQRSDDLSAHAQGGARAAEFLLCQRRTDGRWPFPLVLLRVPALARQDTRPGRLRVTSGSSFPRNSIQRRLPLRRPGLRFRLLGCSCLRLVSRPPRIRDRPAGELAASGAYRAATCSPAGYA